MDNHNHDSKFSRFLSGKGFYVALAVCLIGTATAAWIAIDSTQSAILEESSSHLSSSLSSISRSSSTGGAASQSSSSIPSSTAPANETVSDPPASSSTAAPVETPKDQPASAPAAADPESQATATPVEDVAVDEALFSTQEPLAFTMPIEGEVFAVFSQGELVRNVTLGEWRTHDGVDIRAVKGTPVRAVADGVVSQIYTDPMWGTVVEITHAGGLTSVTSGLDSAVAVQQGDTVRVEDTIGVVGTILAEVSLDDHIHFGLKQDGNWVDPLAAMGKVIQ